VQAGQTHQPVVSGRLTPDALYRRLQRLGGAAGIARFSPHDLRRSFVSDLPDAGADLAAVQALAGHRRPETTSATTAAPTRHDAKPPPSSMSPAPPANQAAR